MFKHQLKSKCVRVLLRRSSCYSLLHEVILCVLMCYCCSILFISNLKIATMLNAFMMNVRVKLEATTLKRHVAWPRGPRKTRRTSSGRTRWRYAEDTRMTETVVCM